LPLIVSYQKKLNVFNIKVIKLLNAIRNINSKSTYQKFYYSNSQVDLLKNKLKFIPIM